MEDNKRSLWSRLLDPVFIIGIIISFGISWYFFRIDQKVPEISWAENQQLIFDSTGNAGDLSLVDSSGNRIKESVFASEITFWNSGAELIDATAARSIVRRPLSLQVTGPESIESRRILSISIIQLTKQEPVNLRIENKGSFAIVNWDHLDPNAGFRLRVTYTGSVGSYINSTASIAGMSGMVYQQIYPVRPPSIIPSDPRRERSIMSYGAPVLVLLIIAALGFSAPVWLHHLLARTLPGLTKETSSLVILIISTVLCTGLMIGGFSGLSWLQKPVVPQDWIDPFENRPGGFG